MIDLDLADAATLSVRAYSAFLLGHEHACAGARALTSKCLAPALFPQGWRGSESYRFQFHRVYKAGYDLGVMRKNVEPFA